MSSSQLPNYLRSNRKRLGLSQKEVAFLLGATSEAKVSRYERFAREPSLQAALACEVIFQRSASELFGGLYQQAEKEIAGRAKALVERMENRTGSQQSTQKYQVLKRMMGAVQ